MSVVVVVKTDLQEDNFIWGPFTNEEQATTWAHENLKGLEWHWLPMERPGPTYGSCGLSDLADFAQTALDQGRDCYVAIDDVNWVVVK